MQRVPNFGSLLQSYSLKKILQSLGNEVSFIDIERREEDDALRGVKHHHFEEESECSKNFIPKLKKIDKYVVNRLIIKRLDNKQKALFEKFREDQLHIKNEDNSRLYDYCVIGSDEVFNCLTDSWWGFSSQLFGDVDQADQVITYAASCGATELSQLPEGVQQKIKMSFQHVKAFSVRDENTKKFVESLSCREAERHMDPVVIGNFDEEIEKTSLPYDLPKHYCVIYSYYNRINNKNEINEIRHFCRIHKLDIISIGAPQMWIKNHVVCDPFQMLKIFKCADFIITDTFHGTIFSAKYSSRFAIMIRPSNKNKLLDLIHVLKLQKHLISEMSELEIVASVINDKMKINNISQQEYFKTEKYFREHLG